MSKVPIQCQGTFRALQTHLQLNHSLKVPGLPINNWHVIDSSDVGFHTLEAESMVRWLPLLLQKTSGHGFLEDYMIQNLLWGQACYYTSTDPWYANFAGIVA